YLETAVQLSAPRLAPHVSRSLPQRFDLSETSYRAKRPLQVIVAGGRSLFGWNPSPRRSTLSWFLAASIAPIAVGKREECQLRLPGHAGIALPRRALQYLHHAIGGAVQIVTRVGVVRIRVAGE